MNGKFAAKQRTWLAGALALTASLVSLSVTADDGNLTQQLGIQQQKSRFQLMLEQVQEQVRQRAAAARTSSAGQIASSTEVNFGDRTETVRLAPTSVVGREGPEVEPVSAQRLRIEQAHERDQQRILEHRQQSRALIAATRAAGPIGAERYATKRRELVRSSAQNQRLSLQRKLRR